MKIARAFMVLEKFLKFARVPFRQEVGGTR